MWDILFPRKCIFCKALLKEDETDLCKTCRTEAPDFTSSKNNIPFVAGWTAVWYYRDNVRLSFHRYKFRNALSYAEPYGRFLAMRILQMNIEFDQLSWVPVSFWRRFSRGYDQVLLIAQSVAKELDVPLVRTLKKVRHNPAQSGISDPSQRKANVIGAYAVRPDADIANKTIILIDDVITTGSTVSECAKTLLTAGAKEVYCAAVASAHKDN